MNTWSQEVFKKAWNFATIKHSGQTYGGKHEGEKIDYLNHIGSVVMEVIWCLANTQNTYNSNLIIQTAILHDTLEDTETTAAEIYENFGNDVLISVQSLTKNTLLSTKNEQMLDSLRRIKLQINEIQIVKVADRITNLYHPPYYWTQDKIKYYIEEAKLIYNTLTEADELIRNRLNLKIKEYSKFLV